VAPCGSIHDQLATGTKIRILTIVDTYSRFSPAIVPRFSFRAPDVIAVLDRVGREIGLPKSIRVDLGSEFISRDLDLWAYQRDVTLDFSRPGKPTDRARVRHRSKDRGEGLHRKPERQVPGRVPEHALVHEPRRRGPKMRGLP
jgi:putative transposase